MKSVVKNKNTPVAVEEKKRAGKAASSRIVVTAGEVPTSRIDLKAWEVTHQMKLLWRMIKYGYASAFKQADGEEEVFIKARKSKTKEELLEEYYSLNKTQRSSL